MEKSYIVYKHTCPNGKCYIGITCQSVKKRWNYGRGYDTQLFGKAIQKYGWENITHEILFSGLTLEEAYQKERESIEECKSFDKNFGYNCDKGGAGAEGHTVSEEMREKMRQHSLNMWKDPRIKEVLTRHLAEISKSNVGIKRSSKAVEATRNANSKGVLQYDKDFNLVSEHRSMTDAALSMGAKGNSLLCRVCKDKRKTAYGFYWRYIDEPITLEEIESLSIEKTVYNAVPIIQMGKDGTFIARFDSIHDAGRINGVSFKGIWNALTGRRPTAYGYKWRYANEYNNDREVA